MSRNFTTKKAMETEMIVTIVIIVVVIIIGLWIFASRANMFRSLFTG